MSADHFDIVLVEGFKLQRKSSRRRTDLEMLLPGGPTTAEMESPQGFTGLYSLG